MQKHHKPTTTTHTHTHTHTHTNTTKHNKKQTKATKHKTH